MQKLKEFKFRAGILMRLMVSLLLIYTVCRLGFIVYNKQDLAIDDFKTFFIVMINGLRFDISAIFFVNILFVLMLMLPLKVLALKSFHSIIKYLFLGINIFFILINSVDIVYFPFSQKRMQSDAFLFVTGDKGSELFDLLPTFLMEYSPVWLAFGLLIFVFVRVSIKEFQKLSHQPQDIKLSYASAMFPLMASCIFVLGARGGFQLRPLGVIQASEVAGAVNSPVVMNTPFSVLQTLDKESLTDVQYYNVEDIEDCQSGVHISTGQDTLTDKPNIVIIIVESLSKSYLKYFGGDVETPFLDSLMKNGMVFTNAFANAKESVNGVPAILASVPSMMKNPYVFSRYSSNKVNSLASILKIDGYSSAFFHGGMTGTMGFSSFCSSTGFDKYYGKEDYPEPKDFDGSWGIWDHKFFPFMASKLSTMSPPFVAAVLTMNPHSPFKLPAEEKDKFATKGHPVKALLKYEDAALLTFFDSINKKDWYQNTIFVITGDHTGPNIKKGSKMDDFRIPIIFYSPKGEFKGVSDSVAAQIDIMPTLLNYVNTKTSYFSLGRDLFSTKCSGKSITYHGSIYHFMDQKYYLQYNGETIVGVYNWQDDQLQKNNLMDKAGIKAAIVHSEENMLKVIQVFNHRMINDKFYNGTSEDNAQ
jgi:phosphoglycerol transferase MdoB-like AlkP superfamily enzyme